MYTQEDKSNNCLKSMANWQTYRNADPCVIVISSAIVDINEQN